MIKVIYRIYPWGKAKAQNEAEGINLPELIADYLKLTLNLIAHLWTMQGVNYFAAMDGMNSPLCTTPNVISHCPQHPMSPPTVHNT